MRAADATNLCVFLSLILFSQSHLGRRKEHPNVVSVFLNQGRKLYTTRSWEFMGLEDDGVIRQNSIWEKARFGEDAIIGNLDSSIQVERYLSK